MIWTIVSLYLFVIIIVHIPYIQTCIGTQAAGIISDKIGAEVRIGRIDVGFLNRIILDDIIIYDKKAKEMVKAARLSVRIDLLPLTEGKICISSAQIFGTHFRLYQENARTKPNFQFVLDSLASKDTTASAPLDLRINTFIIQRSSVTFDRYDRPYTNNVFNPLHLNIHDISAYISLKAFNQDSVNMAVKRLAFKEQSGLVLKKLSFKIDGNRRKGRLSSFRLNLPDTELNINEIAADYRIEDNKLVPASLKFYGHTGKSALNPNDLSFLIPTLSNFRQRMSLNCTFKGTGKSLDVDNFSVTSADNGLIVRANGQFTYTNDKPSWTMSVNRFYISKPTLDTLADIFKDNGGDGINTVSRLGHIDLKGKIHSHAGRNVSADGIIGTEAGSIELRFNTPDMRIFHGDITTRGFDLSPLFANEQIGKIEAGIKINGHTDGKKITSVRSEGAISGLEYKAYRYKNISFNGNYADNIVSGKLSINDPNAEIAIDGTVRKTGKASDISIDAAIKRFAPQAINLTRKWGNAIFSAGLKARLSATDINDAVGALDITDFAMISDKDIFRIKNIGVNSGYDENIHFVTLDSDFGHIELKGKFDYNTLDKSFANLIKSKLPTIPGVRKYDIRTNNNFALNAYIKNTEWLRNILQIPLEITRPMTLNGTFNDNTHNVDFKCNIPHCFYDGKEYRNCSIDINSPADALHGDINMSKIMDNGDLLRLGISGNAQDNRLSTSVNWNNTGKKKQHGTLNTVTRFADDSHHSAIISIEPSHININDTMWTVHPATITYKAGLIDIDKFTIANNKQHIIIDGTASKSPKDSIKIELNDIDIEYILDLVNFHSVEFSGRATGHAYIAAPLSDISADGQIRVDNFKFEHGDMGTLNANVSWNKSLKQIDIQAIANDGPGRMTLITGYVSPARDYIDLGIKAEGTRIDFMRSFTSSFLSNVNGQARGEVRLSGPLSTINLTGQLVVNGEATVTSLNCTYSLTNDTIIFIPDEIELRDIPLYDKYGNKGLLYGNIHHKHLTRLSYDLGIKADNLLAYNFNDFGDNTFYGTVFGTGDVSIRGRSGEVVINIDVTPQKNSSFIYNVSNPDAIVNQEFINWNSYTERQDTVNNSTSPKEENNDISTNIHINFLINCTPDATIKLLMDSRANDYITLNGDGVIRATFYNKGSFNMFGTYTVKEGTYGITIQDIIKKNFVFNEGGTILFGGNPYEADLNLQAIHTVNGVSLSDLNIGNSFSSNTVRVNCLMNINGTPQTPRIGFDLDIPSVSTDEKQMIRSIINSEDEMSQQVLYLLGVGRFYPKESNNATAQNENQKSQTSLAMQSLLSSTISNQINNVLSTVINSKNWNFGANISTGNDGWDNAEYEGLLNGRLLNNRLLINGQFGYRDNARTANTSFIGDFDIRYLLFPNGNLAINVYNKTNDRYFTKSSFNTQGIGLIMKKDFSNFKDLFGTSKKQNKK